jgi:hypothetical protein
MIVRFLFHSSGTSSVFNIPYIEENMPRKKLQMPITIKVIAQQWSALFIGLSD